jgi:tetratricopeptide (TPR) repeat protein
VRAPLALALAAAALAAPALGRALSAGGTAEPLVAAGERALSRGERSDDALADAEASTWLGCQRRPRWATAWSVLGGLRLERALLRDDGGLAAGAVAAFSAARAANPLDVWAALGEGRARRALGEPGAAARALEVAVLLEPGCAPAWAELALLRLDGGEVEAARSALARAEAALARARGAALDGDYERALVDVDGALLARLRARCGGRR